MSTAAITSSTDRRRRGSSPGEHAGAAPIEPTIRLAALALVIYLSYVLVRPFFSLVVWSVVLTIAFYPVFDWLAARLNGRRRLAALLITVVLLLIVIGPATWLVLSLIDSLQTISDHLDLSQMALPPPAETVKEWPLIGDSIYQFWDLASTNLGAALAKVAPQLKPLGGNLLHIAADASTGSLKFFASIIIAGFLFSPAPVLVHAARQLSRRLAADRGEAFVDLAGATIRSVSYGVIGISVLQALLAGVGLLVAGVAGANLITSAVLVLGIIQIGPSIVLIPVVIWAWMSMQPPAALLFTAYMVPVNLLDNVLRPVVMGRGLETPTLVILLGVLGGTLAYGITGLFLGPIILAVVWDLLLAWTRDAETPTL
ncbi:MAG TPA: AI-2E family transporter [Xanthobacteraceae bacterium]